MQEATGELRTGFDIDVMPREEQQRYRKVPTKFEGAARHAIASGLPGHKSTHKEFANWAKKVRRATKAKRKASKLSRRKNR